MGFIRRRASTTASHSLMMVTLLALVWRNAPGISTMSTSLSLCTSTMVAMNIDLMQDVVDDVSSLDLYTMCGSPSVRPQPLILSFRFLFRNMRYLSAIDLILSVISLGSNG